MHEFEGDAIVKATVNLRTRTRPGPSRPSKQASIFISKAKAIKIWPQGASGPRPGLEDYITVFKAMSVDAAATKTALTITGGVRNCAAQTDNFTAMLHSAAAAVGSYSTKMAVN